MNFVDSPAASGSEEEGTDDTPAAAALLSLGIPLRPEHPWIRTTEGRESLTFFFEDHSTCGEFSSQEMLHAWDDKEWHAANPTHPLAGIRVYFQNCRRYRDARQHGARLCAVWRGGRMHLLTLHSRGAQPFTEPLPVLGDGHALIQTDDERLSAALCATRVPLDMRRPWWSHGGSPVFSHHAVSPCGTYNARVLALAWQTPQWWTREPQHPFAYIMAAERNYGILLEAVRRTAPMVVLKDGDRTGLLSAAAPDSAQASFFRAWRSR